MSFLLDSQELKSGLLLFRRADVKHDNWYCRVRVPKTDRYKTFSLKTSDMRDAKEKAFELDADVRFRVKHDVPVFDKTFADVAKEYSDHAKSNAAYGQITMGRWKLIETHIRVHLIPYIGNVQITTMNTDKWNGYYVWRKETGKGIDGGPPKDGTLRQEMTTLLSIMNFAVEKGYIREKQVPKGKLPEDKARREEFTLQEYRHLHTFARQWIKDAHTDYHRWYRTMAYNFILIMANTGMRTMEARNLRWRDIDVRRDDSGRKFVTMNVHAKKKYRELVAAENVVTYLDRIKEISKATGSNDYVFTIQAGTSATDLYGPLIGTLLEKAGLLFSSTGARRSTYCFRHTYATFRLMEGIDVYFLAKQMGTSVKMIEDYYGHITPSKNAERILQGISGWVPKEEAIGGSKGGVNTSPAKSKSKSERRQDSED